MLKIWMLTLPLMWLHMSHMGIRALSMVLPSLEGTKFCRVITVDTAQLQAKQEFLLSFIEHQINNNHIIFSLLCEVSLITYMHLYMFHHCKQECKWCTAWIKKNFFSAMHTFLSVAHSYSILRTCKCNYTYARNKSMAVTAPIFTNLPKGHQCYLRTITLTRNLTHIRE